MPLSMPERHSLRGVRLGDVAARSVAERTASTNPTGRKPEQSTEMESTGGRVSKGRHQIEAVQQQAEGVRVDRGQRTRRVAGSGRERAQVDDIR